ncbi:alpha-tocopherol transfer protein-like [Uranotaenia lowii]|uniref:alpha-tocopherol transfer protein-like n=1 Tax=Uranotaenia lowii TaxID=190385 RepID=UPI0024786612|nr:alpha-tocopherol transfer protein-like [Uranotaenia lowii]XP_055598471.1 alpha-tocopherol transfer protein-like [Uranotaenia lowii]
MTLQYDEDQRPYIDFGGDIRLALDLSDYLDDEATMAKAREDIRQTPEATAEGLREFRELLKGEPDLKVPNDDEYLLQFLRPTKFYAKSAFELIKGYYKIKAKKGFIVDNISASAVSVALEERIVQVFPRRDQHGRRIIFLQMGAAWNCSKVPFPEMIRAVHTVVTLVQMEPRTQLHGVVYITNFDSLSLSQLGQFTPKFMKNMLDYGQKCSPMRLKGINLINNSRIFNILFKMSKPFLGQKWGNRIFMHGSDLTALHKQIDPSCLPPWLGGSCDFAAYDGKLLVEFMNHYRSRFDELNSYGYVDDITT